MGAHATPLFRPGCQRLPPYSPHAASIATRCRKNFAAYLAFEELSGVQNDLTTKNMLMGARLLKVSSLVCTAANRYAVELAATIRLENVRAKTR
jgi:hypothetical protein